MKIYSIKITKKNTILDYIQPDKDQAIIMADKLGGYVVSMSIPKHTDLQNKKNRQQIINRLTIKCCTLTTLANTVNPFRKIYIRYYAWIMNGGRKPVVYQP